MTELAVHEQAELARHEAIIEHGLQAFVDVGNALLAIRDRRLYRQDYETFEAYCQTRWNLGRRRAYQMMEAAGVVTNLVDDVKNFSHREAHVSPLASLPPDAQREAWQEAVETAPDGRITARHVREVIARRNGNGQHGTDREHPCVSCGEIQPEASMWEINEVWFCGDCYDEMQQINGEPSPNGSRMKPKTNYPANDETAQTIDACQTPPYALDPLLPYLPRPWTVWEPAAGEGLLVEGLYDAGFEQVVESDVITGQDFFAYEPPGPWDCIVTNPPYSLKYPWLERCYALGRPFALLLPVETLGAKSGQVLFREHGLQVIFMDRRVNFKMPLIGFEGSSAQFPVAWFTFGLDLPSDMVFAELTRDD